MYEMSDIRKNLKIVLDGAPWTVVEFQFVKPGKGQAFTRTRVKNLLTGNVVERTFKSNESLEKADIEEKQYSFSYKEGDSYVFMETHTFDQLHLNAEQIGDAVQFMQDGMLVDVLFWNEKPIGVTPPTFVELKVVETEPGFKGDTSTNTLKPAKMETGATVMVPLFISEGETLKVDTRTGEYVERVRTK
jgi:elongation factor P